MSHEDRPPVALSRRRLTLTLAALVGLLVSALGSDDAASAQQPVAPVAAHADSAPASVTGIVYDSTSAVPLAGARVQVVDEGSRTRSYATTSDSSGHFTVHGITPGRYLVGFLHPALDALGIDAPVVLVDLPAGANTMVTLAIPGPRRLMDAVCGPARSRTDSTGAMSGEIRDADSDAPLPSGTVVVTWNEIVIDRQGLHQSRRRVPVHAREDGTYTVCGLPGADDVIADAELGARHTGLLQVHVPVRGMVRRDFAVGDARPVAPGDSSGSIAHGTARLAGIVRDPDGRAVSGARLFVWGTGHTAESGAGGHFVVDGLPAGTFSIEARALGYSPVISTVDLASARTRDVALAFSQRATRLSSIMVMGKRTASTGRMLDFLDRKQHNAGGHFITADDIARTQPIFMSDALRAAPGIHVIPSRSYGYEIVGRGSCQPAVYIDGMQVFEGSQDLDQLVQPNQVMGIEVYSGLGEGPPQYRSNGCGLVLVWTK